MQFDKIPLYFMKMIMVSFRIMITTKKDHNSDGDGDNELDDHGEIGDKEGDVRVKE